MNFIYSFTINSIPSHCGTVSLPLKDNMVVFGRFRPDEILNRHFNHPAIVGMIHYEAANEFRNDCATLVNRVNATIHGNDVHNCFDQALMFIVNNHVKRCGRIFINDLMSYIDTYCELLLALGVDKKHLSRRYPIILYALTEEHSNYVLEAFNTFDGKHIPFINSIRYENLANHVAKLID